MIEINTQKLTTRKNVLIDGHAYVVRKLGAGDELALSQIVRQLNKLQKKAKSPDLTPEQEEKLFAEFDKLQERSLQIYAGTFDDGGDGSKSLELVSRLNYDERTQMYDLIFNADKVEAATEEVEEGDGTATTDAE